MQVLTDFTSKFQHNLIYAVCEDHSAVESKATKEASNYVVAFDPVNKVQHVLASGRSESTRQFLVSNETEYMYWCFFGNIAGAVLCHKKHSCGRLISGMYGESTLVGCRLVDVTSTQALVCLQTGSELHGSSGTTRTWFVVLVCVTVLAVSFIDMYTGVPLHRNCPLCSLLRRRAQKTCQSN